MHPLITNMSAARTASPSAMRRYTNDKKKTTAVGGAGLDFFVGLDRARIVGALYHRLWDEDKRDYLIIAALPSGWGQSRQ